MRRNMLGKQIFRFLVVGGSATVIDYGIMVALTELAGMNYLLSSGISFSVSVIYNYILSTKWVFLSDESRNSVWKFTVFVVLSIIGLGINLVFMWIFTDRLGISYMISKIGATVVVMVYNFISRKMILES